MYGAHIPVWTLTRGFVRHPRRARQYSARIPRMDATRGVRFPFPKEVVSPWSYSYSNFPSFVRSLNIGFLQTLKLFFVTLIGHCRWGW